MGLEGIISKRADRPYRSGRSEDWIKVQCLGRDEFVIGGYIVSPIRGRAFASLLVGEMQDGNRASHGCLSRCNRGFGAVARQRRNDREYPDPLAPLQRVCESEKCTSDMSPIKNSPNSLAGSSNSMGKPHPAL
jgi:hypothetical protein